MPCSWLRAGSVEAAGGDTICSCEKRRCGEPVPYPGDRALFALDLVGATRSIVLGKKSGLDSVDLKAKELGLSITPEQRGSILAEVRRAPSPSAAWLTTRVSENR